MICCSIMNKYSQIPFRPPAPLKGGLYSVFNKSYFMFLDEPPFRGVGGQNIKKQVAAGGKNKKEINCRKGRHKGHKVESMFCNTL